MIESATLSSEEPEDNFKDIGDELLLKIISFLPLSEQLLALRNVNRHFCSLITTESALLNTEEVQCDLQNPIIGGAHRQQLWLSQDQEINHFILQQEKLSTDEKTCSLIANILSEIATFKEINSFNLYRRHKLLTQLNELLIMARIDLNNTKLDCNGCYLTRFPDRLFTYPHLESYWQNLKHMDLQNNQLVQLPAGMMQLPSLTWLSVTNNKLIRLPHFIGNLKSLKWLYVDYNQLTTLPDGITALSELNTLSISNNFISSLPEDFIVLKRLVGLNAQNNNIHSLPAGLHTMPKLMPDFRYNQLYDIPHECSVMTFFNSESKAVHSLVDLMSTQRAYTGSSSNQSRIRN